MTSGPRASRSARAHQAAGGVFQRELGSLRADGQDSLFDARGEELFDRAFADGQALRLHQVPGVGGDLVELVLEGGHRFLGFF